MAEYTLNFSLHGLSILFLHVSDTGSRGSLMIRPSVSQADGHGFQAGFVPLSFRN